MLQSAIQLSPRIWTLVLNDTPWVCPGSDVLAVLVFLSICLSQLTSLVQWSQGQYRERGRKDKQADGCWRFGVSKMGGELSTSSGFWECGFKYVPDLDQECDGQRSGSPSPWKLCQQLFVWLWTCEFASLHVDSLGWSLGMTVIPMLEHCYEWLRYKVPNTGADRQ